MGSKQKTSRESVEPNTIGVFVSSLIYIPNSNRIAAGSTDGTVRIWDSAHLDRQLTIIGRPGSTPILGLTSSQNGSVLVSVDGDHQIREWRTSDWRETHEPPPGPTTTISSVAVSPDGLHIAVASADAAIYICDARTGDPIATLLRHGDSVNSVTFAKGSSHILTGSDDGTAAVFTCDTCGVLLICSDARSAAR